MSTGSVPLLNEYKHALARRKVTQTITGGSRLRKVPCCVHVIQVCLWTLPLALAAPILVIDALVSWNQWLLALFYGCAVGAAVLIEGIVVHVLRRHLQDPVCLDDDEEEDTVDITDVGEAVYFIFSPKKTPTLLIHPVVSALTGFVSCYLLLPSVISDSVSSLVGVIFVSLISWLVFCNALYSLSTRVPPETAVYRPTDPLGLAFLHRSFYILLVGLAFIILRLLGGIPPLYYQLLYAALCLLPLGWVLGVLPPLDALFPWFMEQLLTRVLGGSPMATDLRLLIMLILSMTAVGITIPLNCTLASMLLTAFGLLLSQDLFTTFKAVLCLLASRQSNRLSRFLFSLCKRGFQKTYRSYVSLHIVSTSEAHSYLLFLVIAIFKGSILLVVALVCTYFTVTLDRDADWIRVFLWVVIASSVVLFLNDALQVPYLFGVLRNCLYPKLAGSVAKIKKKRRVLQYTALPRVFLVAYVLPLVMLVLVGLKTDCNTEDLITHRIVHLIAVARLLRKAWQDTVSTLYELAISSALLLALPSTSTWASLGLPSQAFLVGMCLEIGRDSLRKLSFFFKSFAGFVGLRKQRTHAWLTSLIIASTFVFFPILVALILFSSIISAPLLPLFTLPVFIFSFPRPRRFWPSMINFGSTFNRTEDTVYYQQAESELARALHGSISRGAVSSQPGTQVLFRFDNRLALATILETCYGSCTVNIRGLELQETSCHTEEATKVDDIFDTVHSSGFSLFNSNVLNTLVPVDTVVIQTFSDARNVLTGIIDQPDALGRFSSNLMKTLVWVFFKFLVQEVTISKFVAATAAPNQEVKEAQQEMKGLQQEMKGPQQETKGSQQERKVSQQQRKSSVKPANGSIQDSASYSAEWLHLQPTEMAPKRNTAGESVRGSKGSVNGSRDSVNGSVRGSRASVSSVRTVTVVLPASTAAAGGKIQWKLPPLSKHQIRTLMKDFPHEWYAYLSNRDSRMTSTNKDMLAKTVVGCFSATNSQAHTVKNGKVQTRPVDISQGFQGNFSFSSELNWVTSHPVLHELTLKAYRYAVKLMYDEGSLGEAENWTELADYLSEYDEKWCITKETEEEWNRAILSSKPNLFSLGQDQEKRVYTAHVLTLQDEAVHIGTMNPAALQGIWTDLMLELLYLTNDDEERYSIQAHPYLLRNLSIQMAEPPFGYCIHSSGPLSIPTL